MPLGGEDSGASDVHRKGLDHWSSPGFNTLVRELGLPPIRLHDLRHGAATLALASRTDLKVIQQMLGHSSIVTTADTYTSVLPETAHRAAQATADMVIKAARSAPGPRSGRTALPHIPAAITASGYCQM
jgi:integrase